MEINPTDKGRWDVFTCHVFKNNVGFMVVANTLQFLKISFEDTKNIFNHTKNESVTARQNQEKSAILLATL